jgi:hypothetical protein
MKQNNSWQAAMKIRCTRISESDKTFFPATFDACCYIISGIHNDHSPLEITIVNPAGFHLTGIGKGMPIL